MTLGPIRGTVSPDEARRAVRDLEGARRDNRRRNIDIWEAIYQAYLVGFGLLAVMALASSQLPSEPVSLRAVAWLGGRGGALIGIVVAAAATAGFRSGARGGPLAFDAPTVHFVLQAPVERSFVTRRAALAQLRTTVLWGMLLGAAIGLTVAPTLPGSTVWIVVGFAATGVATAVTLLGCALLAGGRRWRLGPATALGMALVVWTTVDLCAAAHTAPSTLLGSVAFWAVHRPDAALLAPAVLAAVAVAGVAVLGVATCGGVSIEASRRRATLVSQIRFALTMQDLRAVVLLRRRMNRSQRRRIPWVPMRRSTGYRMPFLRRSLQSQLRMPRASLVMVAVLTVAASVSFAGASHGPAVLALLPALFFSIAAYTLSEPLAQEADHPFRWVAHPVRSGIVVKRLTAAAILPMAALGLLAAGVAAPLWSGSTSYVALAALPLGAVGATVGASVGTMMSDAGSFAMNPLQSEVFGLYVVLRIALPLLPALVPLVPATAALALQTSGDTVAVSSLIYTLIAAGVAWLWLGTKAPQRA